MDSHTLAETTALVVAGVAAVRKFAPKLDGKWVLLVVVLVACGFCVSEAYGPTLPQWAKGIRSAIEVAIMAIGGTEWATRLALKIKGEDPTASPDNVETSSTTTPPTTDDEAGPKP